MTEVFDHSLQEAGIVSFRGSEANMTWGSTGASF